jgi:hypothetical protein
MYQVSITSGIAEQSLAADLEGRAEKVDCRTSGLVAARPSKRLKRDVETVEKPCFWFVSLHSMLFLKN